MLPVNIAPTVSDTTSERSMLADPSKDTPCIVLAVASVVAVVAFPSKAATKVPVVIERLPVLAPVAVVVPKVNLSALSSHAKIALSPVLPLSITIPLSLAFVPAPLLSSIKLSATTIFVVETVVVSPFTV